MDRRTFITSTTAAAAAIGLGTDAILPKLAQGKETIPYEQVVAWRFGDFIFNSGFDNITSTIKARRAGFHDCIDTEEMFSNLFDDLRQKRVIPRLS
jgi:hypothetical protein